MFRENIGNLIWNHIIAMARRRSTPLSCLPSLSKGRKTPKRSASYAAKPLEKRTVFVSNTPPAIVARLRLSTCTDTPKENAVNQ